LAAVVLLAAACTPSHPQSTFDTLGPGMTAMNKLLAQTEVCRSGSRALISERARDIYDLARIAIERDRFEGHIGRDSKALLHIAESWTPSSDRKRPPNGFASLASFDASTPEHRALADGYESVMNEMVWGQPIPLDEAINHALSLDPGPPEPPPKTTRPTLCSPSGSDGSEYLRGSAS